MSSPETHRYSCCCLDGQAGPCQPSPSRCADRDCPCLEDTVADDLADRAGALRWGLPFHSYRVEVQDPVEGAREVYEMVAVNGTHAAGQAVTAFGGLKGKSERFQVKVLHGPIF